MEAETRQPDPALVRDLLEAGHRFWFFRAIQLLEEANPGASPLGGAGPARDEIVRLRPDTSFALPRTSVARVETIPGDDRVPRRFRVTSTFFGLYGVRSPIPEVYGEEILKRQEDVDAVRDFLDLFHHRLLSLLYRAWARPRPHVGFRHDGAQRATRVVFAAGGFADDAVRQAAGLPPPGLLRYSAFFARPARTAEGLATILSDFLGGARVAVEPYALRQVAVPEEQRARLGRSGCRLGRDFSLGTRVEDRSGKFRLRIGPLDLPSYMTLAPGGEARDAAGRLIHLYLIDPLEHDAALGIRGESRPAFRLSAESRLGIDTWLNTGTPEDSWVLFPGFPPTARAPEAPEAPAPEESAA